MIHVSGNLGLLLGTEAPVMTPNGVHFSFLFFLSGEYAYLQKVGMPDTSSPMVIAVGK